MGLGQQVTCQVTHKSEELKQRSPVLELMPAATAFYLQNETEILVRNESTSFDGTCPHVFTG